MLDVLAFTPIINLPECAVLGLGKITPRYQPVEEQIGSFKKTQMIILSLTFDHRLVDGAEAARFLQYIKSIVESPLSLLFQ